jgi:hypothetical protein
MLNNIKKRLYAVVLTMAMIMTIIVPVNVSAANVGSGLLTVDKYEEYLKSESYEDFKKFTSLTEGEQQKLVDILQKPETYLDNNSVESLVKKSNERITFDTLTVTKRASRVNRNTWGTSTVTVFGIDVLQYKIEAGYKVTRGRIKSINYYDAYVVKNLNPMLQTSTLGKYSYISNNKVYTKGTFYYKLGPIKGLSVQIGNIYGQLISYPNGSSTISYWRD